MTIKEPKAMFLEKIRNKKAGFSLVEVLIFSLIVVIVVLTFYKTFASGSKVLRDARARMSAAQVANEKFESLRNITYEDLETETGTVQATEIVHRSGIEFKVFTGISYVDDTFDGDFDGTTGTVDLKSGDYKQVEVTVSWLSGGETKSILLYTYIAPPGTEEQLNGGVLSIDVRRSDGSVVEGAQVTVYDLFNNSLKGTFVTPANGKISLLEYTPGDERYRITVSKDGYYTVETMAPYNATPYDPVDEHASVVKSNISNVTITLDPLYDFEIKTEDPLGNPVGNIDFFLEGGRKMGDTVPSELPVFAHAKDANSTNASGSKIFSDQSLGQYDFEFSTTSANNMNYEFWRMDSAGDSVGSFMVNGNPSTFKAIVLPKNVPSIFLRIVAQTDLTPLSDMNVRVKKDDGSYDKTQVSDKFGQVYFPVKEEPAVPLTPGHYIIEVQTSGGSQQFEMDVNNLVSEDMMLLGL